MPRLSFIPIAEPRYVDEPIPTGADWLHEPKPDGFRLQIHAKGPRSRLYSREGHDFTDRYPSIAAAAGRLVVTTAVIDGELVACDGNDQPDFYALLLNKPHHGLCVWCFDLLEVNGRDMKREPLWARKQALADILPGRTLRYLEHFGDGVALLADAETRKMEGIVSKRRNSLYLPGTRCGWRKTKTAHWRVANKDRHKLFER